MLAQIYQPNKWRLKQERLAAEAAAERMAAQIAVKWGRSVEEVLEGYDKVKDSEKIKMSSLSSFDS